MSVVICVYWLPCQLDDIEKAYELFAHQRDGVMKVAIKTGV